MEKSSCIKFNVAAQNIPGEWEGLALSVYIVNILGKKSHYDRLLG